MRCPPPRLGSGSGRLLPAHGAGRRTDQEVVGVFASPATRQQEPPELRAGSPACRWHSGSVDRSERPEAHIEPGVFYEDCAYHPVLCTHASTDDDELEGISLIDGTVRACSMFHCGAEVLTLRQVIAIKRDFNAYVASRQAGGETPPED